MKLDRTPFRGRFALHAMATTTPFASYTFSPMRMRLYPPEPSSVYGTWMISFFDNVALIGEHYLVSAKDFMADVRL